MRTRRAVAAALALALGAGLLAACGGGGGGRLVVYSGRTEDLIGPLLERFADETGVGIDVLYGDSADLAVQLDTEGDRSRADVFVSQSPGALGFLDGEGRLLPLPERVLDLVDGRFRADDGDWVGLSGRVRVLVYHSGEADPADLPGSVLDLVDQQYAGRVGIAPTNGSFQDFVTGMRVLLGDDATREWLDGMADNGARAYANNEAVRQAVERGEVDFGLVNHYYNERAKAEDPDVPTENHLFDAGDPGSMILVTAAGILDTAGARRGDAERLVEFLLGERAQRYFAAETFEYPLAAGVEPVVADLPPIEEIAAPRLDLSELGGGLQATREMIRSSGLERG
jgi:iron(III) transport system substrate-binding protein